MRKNIGLMDAYVRLTCGFSMIGIGILKKSKFMITLGAMKTAEGITRFCPMYHYIGMSTKNTDNIMGAIKDIIR